MTRRKRHGQITEPSLPPRTVVREGNVTIKHYTGDREHPPPHLHVIAGEYVVRIGQNGHPLRNEPDLNGAQLAVVHANRNIIRKAVHKIARWHRFDAER
jgi:hypothetical protein